MVMILKRFMMKGAIVNTKRHFYLPYNLFSHSQCPGVYLDLISSLIMDIYLPRDTHYSVFDVTLQYNVLIHSGGFH